MFKFSVPEVRDLLISFLVISLGFAVLNSGMNFSLVAGLLPAVMVGVGLGFIFHELAHKFVAMHYNFYAEYKMWTIGLVIALVSPFLGFIFAAPGAVHIYGQYMSDRENGIISIAGPLLNIVLSIIFLLCGAYLFANPALIGFDGSNLIFQTCLMGFSINAFLALFNLIPFSVLDGAKIFRWDPLIWLVTAAVAGGLVLVSFTSLEQVLKFLAGAIFGGVF
ncbi:MAG: site-2 protease family protein [Methanobrevibacter sp.]|jgi:Zn-dependent protease|nr:site-2 protease family protein [Methanobrevibacter sp.]